MTGPMAVETGPKLEVFLFLLGGGQGAVIGTLHLHNIQIHWTGGHRIVSGLMESGRKRKNVTESKLDSVVAFGDMLDTRQGGN